MTDAGGTAGDGTIFRIGTDGSAFALTHSFAGLPNDGSNPSGSLIQSGTSLYGLTKSGGSANTGTVFKIGVDGTGLSLLHQFTGGADGSVPLGSLFQSGSAVYGMTSEGGTANLGTIFKINTDGTGGVTVLHSFAGGPVDGQRPSYSALVESGATLYGMTVEGGSVNRGVVFRINIDGSGFALLHSFTGGPSDGDFPYGSLTFSGSALYGMTRFGGAAGAGTAFRISTDGTGFSLLHSFAGGPADGSDPSGDLLLSGSMLYGMTYSGGVDALGTLFGMGTDGSNYSVLHSFAGGLGDGADPIGDLIISGGTLFGMTNAGGSNNLGIVFSFPASVPEPSSLMLVAAGTSLALLIRR